MGLRGEPAGEGTLVAPKEDPGSSFRGLSRKDPREILPTADGSEPGRPGPALSLRSFPRRHVQPWPPPTSAPQASAPRLHGATYSERRPPQSAVPDPFVLLPQKACFVI